MIAFDIDGCLNGIKNDLIRLGSTFFDRNNITFNPRGYYLKEIYSGASQEAYDEFWVLYGFQIYTNPPLKGVWDTINYLKRNSIDACYITTRNTTQRFGGIRFDKLTEAWLKKYDIELPVYYEKDKVSLAKSLDVTLMVEDKPKNIESLSKSVQVLIFKHPYNEHLNGIFVDNWKDILDFITSGNLR